MQTGSKQLDNSREQQDSVHFLPSSFVQSFPYPLLEINRDFFRSLESSLALLKLDTNHRFAEQKQDLKRGVDKNAINK